MGKTKAGDLFLNSDVHVKRGENKDGSPKIEIVKGNRMVSETDLTDKEIESIKPFKVLRAPTIEEMQAAEDREENEGSADAAKAAEEERVRLLEEQKIEADMLEAKQKKEAADAKAKLEESQAKEREAAEKKAAGSGKGSKR